MLFFCASIHSPTRFSALFLFSKLSFENNFIHCDNKERIEKVSVSVSVNLFKTKQRRLTITIVIETPRESPIHPTGNHRGRKKTHSIEFDFSGKRIGRATPLRVRIITRVSYNGRNSFSALPYTFYACHNGEQWRKCCRRDR